MRTINAKIRHLKPEHLYTVLIYFFVATSIFSTDYGVMIQGNPWENTFHLIPAAGLKWVRLTFRWDLIFSSESEYSFDTQYYNELLAIIDSCQTNDIQVLGVLYSAPVWAITRVDINPNSTFSDYERFIDNWKDYVTLIIGNNSEEIKYWEVWSEPNSYPFFDLSIPRNENYSVNNQIKNAMVYDWMVRETRYIVDSINDVNNYYGNQKIKIIGPGGVWQGLNIEYATENTEIWKDFFFDSLKTYRFLDGISWHAYVSPYSPSDEVNYAYKEITEEILSAFSTLPDEAKHKEFWITEVGFNGNIDFTGGIGGCKCFSAYNQALLSKKLIDFIEQEGGFIDKLIFFQWLQIYRGIIFKYIYFYYTSNIENPLLNQNNWSMVFIHSGPEWFQGSTSISTRMPLDIGIMIPRDIEKGYYKVNWDIDFTNNDIEILYHTYRNFNFAYQNCIFNANDLSEFSVDSVYLDYSRNGPVVRIRLNSGDSILLSDLSIISNDSIIWQYHFDLRDYSSDAYYGMVFPDTSIQYKMLYNILKETLHSYE